MDVQKREDNAQASGTPKQLLCHHIVLPYRTFREKEGHIGWLKHEFFKNYVARGSETEDKYQ